MDYTNLDDQALMRRISQKDENALSELYDRFSRLVYSIALNSLGDLALAEEVMQDVFFRVWKNAASYRAEHGKVITWMAGITRNRAIDEIRRMNARPETNLAPWDLRETDLVDDSTNVEADLERTRRHRRVRYAIAQLPIDQQQALAYSYFWGYSHREIAVILGEPLGTVKTRIRLAMKKLKTLLEIEVDA